MVLLMMVGTQVTTYLLTKRLTGRDDAAVLAALAFTFSGYALGHWGHPQLQTLGLLPLGFLLLFRVLDVPSTGRAVAFGIATAALALGAQYYGLLFAVCAATIVVGHLVSQRYRLKPGLWRALAISAGLAGSDRRTVRDPVRQAPAPARLRSAVRARVGIEGRRPVHTRAAQLPVRLDGAHRHRARRRAHALPRIRRDGPRADRPRRRASPTPGTHVARRHERGPTEPVEDRRHRELRLLLLAGVVSIVLAIGPEVYGITMPMGVLHDHVPGFGGIRVASRLAVVAWLTVAVLAGVGFATLTRRLSTFARGSAAVLVGALILLELAAPTPTAAISTSDATLDVYRALDDRGTEPSSSCR